MLQITTPRKPQEWDAVRDILREYAATLNVDLCFQRLGDELVALPGQYAGPRGALENAIADNRLAGCRVLRPLDNADYSNACEMKRLFVARNFASWASDACWPKRFWVRRVKPARPVCCWTR